ncbi:MAG: two-component system sensor histidine kinase CpxA [Gammaproteobacteria bacterium]|jgi:two-component system sensor histidine kinase CpxA
MNRLFTKLFLAFWMTTIAVVAITVIVTTQVNRSRGDDSLQAYFKRTQSAYAQAASSILDSEGLDELRLWMIELQGPGGVDGRLQLLGDSGKAVFGSAPARDIRSALAERKAQVGPPSELNGVFFDPLYGPAGERYWFVSDMRGSRRLGAQPIGPALRGFRLTVAILVSSLVCLILARYLATPIRKLQAATAEIAAGNYKVRVNMRRRRDELGDLGRDFDRMAEQLERLDAAQHQLIRDVSHELRSPLARLHIALGLAQRRLGDAVSDDLGRIQCEAQALEELIRQLLSVSRLESGLTDVSEDVVSIGDVVRTVVADANFEGADKAKSVVFESCTNATVRGDRSLLQSVFENVVRNALMHTPSGTTVKIHSQLAGDSDIVVAVEDCGPGVPEAQIEAIFKPFVRGDYARNRASGGYGIGLAIAHAAVKKHGGAITAANRTDGGFCVKISLPTLKS